MKKILTIILITLFSCNKQSVVNSDSYQAEIISFQKLYRAGQIFDLKINLAIQNSDLATSIEVCRNSFQVNLTVQQGQTSVTDFSVNQNVSSVTYVLRTKLKTGETIISNPVTFNY